MVFDNGSDLTAAAATAANADVAIVFGYYLEGEGADRPASRQSQPDDGATADALIAAVAAANPNTIVILQTGGPVLMPWIDQVKGVLEVWYAGVKMGPAIAGAAVGRRQPVGQAAADVPGLGG